MGYGHASEKQAYRKNYRTARKIARRNYKNRAVKRIMRKPRGKTVNKRQTQAIFKLGKQVRSLQLADRGDLQYQMQDAKFVNAVGPAATSTLIPTMSGPILFPFNSFYNKTVFYKGTLANQTPGYGILLDPAGDNNSFEKQAVTADLGGQYNWSIWNNTTEVSKNSYLPVYCRLRIRIGMNMRPQDLAQRFRVTLFKTRRMPVPNQYHEYQLPDCLGAYRNMCCDDPARRNHFSKSYHRVLLDRFVTFMPPSGASVAADKVIQQSIKTVTIPYQFPAKLLQPRVKQFQLFNDSFIQSTSQDEIIWCLISSNQPDSSYTGGNTNPPTNAQPIPSITLSRYLTWRDKAGTTVGWSEPLSGRSSASTR